MEHLLLTKKKNYEQPTTSDIYFVQFWYHRILNLSMWLANIFMLATYVYTICISLYNK